MEARDWRAQLLPESRGKIVDKIIETLKMYVPSSPKEASIKKVAENFEERVYAAARDKKDYIERISLKLLNVREKSSRNAVPNSSLSRPSCPGETLESHGIQSQVDKHGKPPASYSTSQSQPHLSLNAEKTIASSGISSSLPSAWPPLSDLTVTAVPNVVTEVPNLQSSSGISQNSVGNAAGQGLYADLAPNNLMQVQGTQHLQHVVNEQSIRQSPKLLHDSYQLQLQAQLLKQHKQDCLAASHLQNHIQEGQLQEQLEQNNLQNNHLQPCQQSVMQTSFMPSFETQPPVVPDHLQSQQSLQPLLMKHSQKVPIQPQQTQQAPVTCQNESTMQGQLLFPLYNQPQVMKRNMAATRAAQNPLIGQQNSEPNSLQHQQRSLCLLNNSQNLTQQQLARRRNFSVPQQQQQLLGKESNNSSMHQSHAVVEGKIQQTASALLPTQGQQLQQSLPQRQLIYWSQLEKMQQLPNSSQQDRMESFQRSGVLNPSLEKRLGDCQEEAFQMIEILKTRYLNQLNGLLQTLTNRVQQHGSVAQQPKTSQTEKFILMLNQIIAFLNVPKSNLTPAHNLHLDTLEKKIISVLYSGGKKSVSSPQQGKFYPDVQSVKQLQEPQTQTSQVQRLEEQKVPQLKSTNSQSIPTVMLQRNLTSLQLDSESHLSEPATLQQNMMHSIEHLTNSENSMTIMHQVAKGSLQSPASLPQQASRLHMNGPQSKVTPSELSSNTLQNKHLKQTRDHLDGLSQIPKQEFEEPEMQQQLVHLNNQKLQWQQAEKPQAQEKQQNQLNKVNDLEAGLGISVKEPQNQDNAVNNSRVKQEMVFKSGPILEHQSVVLPTVYNSQHSNSGALFLISSPEVSFPPLARNSPQIDLKNLQTPLTGAGTHFHTANSTFAIPSSSLTQSSTPQSREKLSSDTSSLVDMDNIGHHGPASQGSGTSLVICTSGMSASALLEGSGTGDGIDGKTSKVISDESPVAEKPLQCLINAVSSISSQAFNASIDDIQSVLSLTDRISSSPLANGSRASIGEDLVAMTNSCLQESCLTRQNDSSGARKRKHLTSSMHSNLYSINAGIHEHSRQWIGVEKPELEFDGTSSIKKPWNEAKHALLEEIREINQQLIDTVVVISDEDTIPTAAAAAAAGTEGGEVTIVKCSFSAITISPNFRSQQVSAKMSLIQPLILLVPKDYPCTSPVLLDEMLLGAREDLEDLSAKVKSKLNASLRSTPEAWSVGKIVRTWDYLARAVISEYAEQNGGGHLSSKYGAWENCLSAA